MKGLEPAKKKMMMMMMMINDQVSIVKDQKGWVPFPSIFLLSGWDIGQPANGLANSQAGFGEIPIDTIDWELVKHLVLIPGIS